jgi:NAD-dependent DNA ligase
MPPKKKVKAPSLAGEVCAFTGFRDENLAALIVAAGGTVANSMTKAVTMVVCKSTSNTTAKIQEAIARGAKLISKEDLEADLQVLK